MLAPENSQYWWYRSHSFQFASLTWEFTYIEATAGRSIAATDEDGKAIDLTVPIKEISKYRSPLEWLKKWGKTKGKRYIEAREARVLPPKTLLEALDEGLEITPSNCSHSWQFCQSLDKYICEYCGEETEKGTPNLFTRPTDTSDFPLTPSNLELCLPISTVLREAGDSPLRRKKPGASKQSKRSTTTPTRNSSGARISQPSLFPGISENLEGSEENTTLSVADFLAQGPATPEREPDSLTPNQPSGEKESDYLSNADPDFLLLNNLREWSIEDFDRFLEDSEWQDIRGTLRKSSRPKNAEPDTVDPDYLLFPTLTANKGATNRPAGQSRCEKWWRDAKLISNGLQLSGAAMAAIMGFPLGWYKVLEVENLSQPNTPPSPTPLAESERDTSQVEPSHRPRRESSSIESSTFTTSDSGATASLVDAGSLLGVNSRSGSIESAGSLLGVNEPEGANWQSQRYAPSSEISPSKSSSSNSRSAETLLGVNEQAVAIETLLGVNEQAVAIETLLGVNEQVVAIEGNTAETLLGVKPWNPDDFGPLNFTTDEEGQLTIFPSEIEPPDPDDYESISAYQEAWREWESGQPDRTEPVSIESQLTPSKCFSCHFAERIRSSPLFTCLANGKYFTEETAKECDRYTPAGKLEEIPKDQTAKRPRRPRGQGSGSFITTYANQGKYGKKYPQTSYQVEFGGKKRSTYIPAEKVDAIRSLDRAGKPIKEMLEAIDSPKAREVMEEYRRYLKDQLGVKSDDP
jgi:hypothetical protein